MITISISSYNQAEYLPKAIESALNQTMPCNILVIDDGSTDNSLQIARRYPVEVISQVNKGLSSARNTGLINCETEWILFLDADDILKPNCVEEVLKKIQEHNKNILEPDVIGLSFQEFGLRNNIIQLMPNPTLEDFKTGNRIGYCSAIKTSVLKEVGGYNSKMVYGWEDWDLWHDLLKRGKKIITTSEILWLYRVKENSMYTDSLKYKDFLTNQLHLNHPEIYGK